MLKRNKMIWTVLWVLGILCLAACTPEEIIAGASGTVPTVTQEEEITVSFLYEGASDFSYQRLSESEKLWYDEIEQALGSMKPQVRLSEEGLADGLNEDSINKIFQCVLNDHPEIFYADGYSYTRYERGTEIVAYEFAGRYEITVEEALKRKDEIEIKTAELLTGIASDACEYDKVKYVYDTLISMTDYDLTASDNQNIYSVFAKGKSVCQGYAKATQYLLNRLGLECTLVQGQVAGEGHAWNLVSVDDNFYYVDTTWGDASYRSRENGDAGGNLSIINYDYLCVTTEQIFRTHTPDSCVPLPECISTEANYYVMENLLLDAYDSERIQQIFADALAEGKEDVTLKCADAACLEEVMQKMIEEQEIFQYLDSESRKIGYTCNEEQMSLTFWMTNEQ